MLLEEIKGQNQTQILLLQQLASGRMGGTADADIADELSLPLSSLDEILKLENDCGDRDVKSKLVHFSFPFQAAYQR